MAETLGGRLTAFDIDDDGSLSGRREWAALPWCAPDGICLDAEGRVWVANAITSECILVAEGGEIVSRVATSQNCFACMLGGDDRRTLYLVTAPTSTESVVSVTRSGRIEQARVDGGRGRASLTAQRSRVSDLRRLRTPWPMRCSFSMRANRTWSSPPGPKPTPGEVATSASVTRNLENSSEPISR